MLERVLGPSPDGLAWATGVLQRMAEHATGEGRALFSGLVSLGYPDDPMGAFWRAADVVREHRGDSHIAAWIGADLDACEIGVLTDPWRGQPLKSWVRSRGWTEEELDEAIERLRSRGLLDGDELTGAGRALPRGDRVGHRRDGGPPRACARRRRRAAVRAARPVVRGARRGRQLPGPDHLAELGPPPTMPA